MEKGFWSLEIAFQAGRPHVCELLEAAKVRAPSSDYKECVAKQKGDKFSD